LQKDADWMKRWTSTQVTIEGHCDERGSAGYNLGLGSSRAAAVKDYLVSLGIPASRITVVSKGKEQPFCNDKNESCYQQNGADTSSLLLNRGGKAGRAEAGRKGKDNFSSILPPVPPLPFPSSRSTQFSSPQPVFRRLLSSTNSTGISRP
jgi:hypothetical protein